MNKNVFKIYLEELLKQIADESNLIDKQKKAQLLMQIEMLIETLDFISNRFHIDYSKEKNFFCKVQVFILLDEFVQAYKFISSRLIKLKNKTEKRYA